MRRIAILSVVLAFGLVACGVSSGSSRQASVSSPTALPSGGISRDRAVAITLADARTTADHLESALVGKFAQFAPGQHTARSYDSGTSTSTPDELVWAVTIGGKFVHPCVCCGACGPARHETLLIDYYSGEVVLYILRQ